MKAADNLGESLNLKETEAMVWQMFLSFLRRFFFRATPHTSYDFTPKKKLRRVRVANVETRRVFSSDSLAVQHRLKLWWLLEMIVWCGTLQNIRSHARSTPKPPTPIHDAISLSSRPATTKENCCYANLRLWRVSALICLPENIITKTKNETKFPSHTKNHDLWSRNGNAPR